MSGNIYTYYSFIANFILTVNNNKFASIRSGVNEIVNRHVATTASLLNPTSVFAQYFDHCSLKEIISLQIYMFVNLFVTSTTTLICIVSLPKEAVMYMLLFRGWCSAEIHCRSLQEDNFYGVLKNGPCMAPFSYTLSIRLHIEWLPRYTLLRDINKACIRSVRFPGLNFVIRII